MFVSETIHDQILALHKQWSYLDQSARPKAFWRFVARNNKTLFDSLYLDPAPLRSLSRRIQADWKGEVLKGVGAKIRRKYIAELTRRYLAGGHDAPTIEAFVNGIVAQCGCEADLRDLLAKPSS